MCSQQARFLCTTLASLCEHHTTRQIVAEYVVSIESILTKTSSTHGYDKSYLQSDVSFVQRSKQCFLVELIALMKNSKSTISLHEKEKSLILRSFIEALVDADAINTFPTGNLKALESTGGVTSRQKEQKVIKRLYHRFETSVHEGSNIKNNLEKICLHRSNFNFITFPGHYMATNFWSFTQDLGIVLTKQSDVEDIYHKIGLVLLNDIDDDPMFGEVYEDLLESLPLLSLERQCFKRFIKVLAIFKVSIKSAVNNQMLMPLQTDLISVLTKEMIQHLDGIVKGVEYQHKCNTKSYEYAKASILQHAYTQFFISNITWILREVSLARLEMKDIGEYFYRNLLQPSLKGSFHDGTIFSTTASSRASVIRYDYLPSIGSPHHDLKSFKKELFNAVSKHVRELVLYAATIIDTRTRNTLFYEIMDAALFSKFEKEDVQLLPALVDGVDVHLENPSSPLCTTFNLSFALSSESGSIHFESNAIKQFRTFAIRKFMLPKLKHKDDGTKISILRQLYQLLNIRFLTQRCGNHHNFSIGFGDEDQEYLDFQNDLCLIIYSLTCLLLQTQLSAELVKNVYKCLIQISYLKFKDGKTIVEWCQSYSNDDIAIRYFKVEMKLLFYLSCVIVKECTKEDTEAIKLKCKSIILNDRQRILSQEKLPFASTYLWRTANNDAINNARILEEKQHCLLQSSGLTVIIKKFIQSFKDLISS